jgi:hypothetical protein
MIQLIGSYFSRLTAAFGAGWTRFWFTPADPTTLSAMRVAVGLLAVYLHATLALDLVALFGPNGLLPAADIAPLEGGTFSYMNYVQTPAELWAVHLAGLVVLVLFTAGFWTRITSVLSLLVFLSVVQRAPMIAGRTESIVAMLLLYLCLAPCGRRFSIDAWLSARAGGTLVGLPQPELATTATIATRLIQVHLALLVAMMAFSQLAGEVWWSGTGMWWLITRSQSRLVDFTWLESSPKIVDFWSHALVLYELAFAVLVWVPLARPLLLGLGVLAWTSLALVTGDVTFALAMMIASTAFVSPSLVRALVDRPAPAASAAT